MNLIKTKKLVIVSHTPHYKKDDIVMGWGPTVREIDHLAALFKEVIHIAPLTGEKAPESSFPYNQKNISFKAVKPSGGKYFYDKIFIFFKIPQYIRLMLSEFKSADVVHVRCPAGISLIAIIVLIFIKKPKIRWIKYAGNWNPIKHSPFSYSIQRWLLKKNFFRGFVTVNGQWQNQAEHITSFLNPCLTEEELINARKFALIKEMSIPLNLIFVGRLEDEKGVSLIIEIANKISQKKIPFIFNLIGDGSARPYYEKMVNKLNLQKNVFFNGWIPQINIDAFYKQAHLLVLPTEGEGWPKVLSEAMAYGTIVVVSAVSCIPDYLNQFQTGTSIIARNADSFEEAILKYCNNPSVWKKESLAAIECAKNFTYEKYQIAVQELLR